MRRRDCGCSTSTPFPNLKFEEFGIFTITKEKPAFKATQDIHDHIGTVGEDSIFTWVARHFATGWLLCDDGPGEVADFLHITNEGVLTAIHVKAAHNQSDGRQIAVTAFEQVVSQAEKSVRLLRSEALATHLAKRSIERPACWHDGRKANSRDFVDQVRMRTASDRTQVVIIQPHLLEAVCLRARTARDEGRPTRDSYSLTLLDTLLHSTRRTVTSMWDDLTVFGSK
jgi:hypothetical protein